MKPTLLKSFIVVALFWWTVTFIIFGVSSPQVNLDVLTRVATTLHALHLPGPTAADIPKHVSVLNELSMQIAILKYWAPLYVVGAVVFAAVGVGIAWLMAWRERDIRTRREQGSGSYRGIRVSKGAMPVPAEIPKVDILLGMKAEAEEIITKLPPIERQLLEEVIGTMAAHPEAYPGEGHGDLTLLQHTLNVVEKVVIQRPNEPLAVVAAAAHDLGKITSFRKDKKGHWERIRWHDKESARLLALLPAFWDLPTAKRSALILATKYGHSMDTMPMHPDPEVNKLAEQLAAPVKLADGQATKEEKQRFLEDVDASNMPVSELVLRAFKEALPVMVFQNPGLPAGVKAVGWKKDGKLYFIEHQVREQSMKHMDAHLRAALGGTRRETTRIAPFSLEFMRVLEAKGWLVREIGAIKLTMEEALWNVHSGTKEFKGVIIMTIPDELLEFLPPNDTAYPLEVVGAHFRSPTEVPAAELGLDDSGLFRKPGGKRLKAPSEKRKAADTPDNPATEPVAEGVTVTEAPAAAVTDNAAVSTDQELKPSAVLASVLAKPDTAALKPETPEPGVVQLAESPQPAPTPVRTVDARSSEGPGNQVPNKGGPPSKPAHVKTPWDKTHKKKPRPSGGSDIPGLTPPRPPKP